MKLKEFIAKSCEEFAMINTSEWLLQSAAYRKN